MRKFMRDIMYIWNRTYWTIFIKGVRFFVMVEMLNSFIDIIKNEF